MHRVLKFVLVLEMSYKILFALFNFVLLDLFFFQSVYFTENSGYRSLKNRSCVTVFGSCSATLTVGEPLGDVTGFANHDFRTSVTGIFGEIDASFFFCIFLRLFFHVVLSAHAILICFTMLEFL